MLKDPFTMVGLIIFVAFVVFALVGHIIRAAPRPHLWSDDFFNPSPTPPPTAPRAPPAPTPETASVPAIGPPSRKVDLS